MIRRNLLKGICIVGLVSTLVLTGCSGNTKDVEVGTEVAEENSEEIEATENLEKGTEEETEEETEEGAEEKDSSNEGTEETKESETTSKEEDSKGSSDGNSSSGSSSGKSSNSGSSSSNSNSSSNSSGSSSSSNSGSSTPAPTSAPVHEHSWTPVYRTVHHDAVTHTEDQGHYEDQGHWDAVCICNTCGLKSANAQEIHDHQINSQRSNPDDDSKWHIGETTKTEWVSNNVWIPNVVTVTDQAAYDEQVLDHYECSCGATK